MHRPCGSASPEELRLVFALAVRRRPGSTGTRVIAGVMVEWPVYRARASPIYRYRASCPCLGHCYRRDRPRLNCRCRSGLMLRLSFRWALPLGFPNWRRDRLSWSHGRLGRRSARTQPIDCLAVRSRGLQNTLLRVLPAKAAARTASAGETETVLALVYARGGRYSTRTCRAGFGY
jgi:hypothetical protein